MKGSLLLLCAAATLAAVLGCDQVLQGSGTFSSPGYPNNYDHNLDCAFTLSANTGFVNIYFDQQSELESGYSGDCSYDYVEVIGDGTSLGKYCGTSFPSSLPTGKTQVVVNFHSDGSINRRGFSATFSSSNSAPPTGSPTSAPTAAPGGCGGSFSGPTGTVTSPGYPNDYESNQDCTYTITAPSGPLKLSIDMALEASSTCSYDYVTINGGSPMCGTVRRTVRVDGASITLRFVSDSSVVASGFTASWGAWGCADAGGECVDSCDGRPVTDTACPSSGQTCCVPRFDQGDCGRVPLDPDTRIINGGEANANHWPWQASLQTTSSSFHFCGASLVKEQWVVTAAHCVDGDSPSAIKVILGEHDFGSSTDGEEHAVSEIFVHESYEQGSGAFPNDIALLKLASRVTYNDNVQPVCLAEIGDVFHTNNDCWITGWGKTESGSSPDKLVELNIDVLDQPTCVQKWGTNINDGHICLGNGLSGACNGDSGGPLVCSQDAGNGKYFWKLAGATSWGRSGCQTEGFPSVYSRITYFHNWITSTISQNGN